ncbi:MAG: hypothetical protein JNL98_38350 [Bryobacterales bacterium]|nr:hypothetical protein [Bryobacterales bacterium]
MSSVLDPEYDFYYESEFEDEMEGFNPFRSAWDWVTKPGSPQRATALDLGRRAAAQAGSVGRTAGEWGGSRIGQAIGGRFGLAAPGAAAGRWLGGQGGQWLGNRAGSWLSGILPDSEFEAEMLMQHYAHAAAEAESEAEAEAFIGALAPLATRLLPAAGRLAGGLMRGLGRGGRRRGRAAGGAGGRKQRGGPSAGFAGAASGAVPGLVRGLSGAVRTMRRNPQTRGLINLLPQVARNTILNVGRQAAQGAPITPGGTLKTFASTAARILGNPRVGQAALRRARYLDGVFHRVADGSALPGEDDEVLDDDFDEVDDTPDMDFEYEYAY